MLSLSVNDLKEAFDDLQPIPLQERSETPVCQIAYTPEFSEAYEYLRAVLSQNETSERALALTGLCLKLNPANYTVWHYRRQILSQLYSVEKRQSVLDNNEDVPSSPFPSFFRDDLAFATQLGGRNPKNYQIWYHRRAMLEPFLVPSTTYPNQNKSTATITLNAPSSAAIFIARSELDYIATVLEEDAKNYHAWSHRQFILRSTLTLMNEDSDNATTLEDKDDILLLWKEELEYVHKLITLDIRNNSAWNQRWFVVHNSPESPSTLTTTTSGGGTVTPEMKYALRLIQKDPYNESPWTYVLALLKEHLQQLQESKTLLLEFWEQIDSPIAKSLKDAGHDPNGCAPWTSARINILELLGDASSLDLAMELSLGLATEYDVIRKKYWLLRVHELKQKRMKALALKDD